MDVIYSFFFLSNFQTLKFFVTFFSGTVRPRRLKLSTHVDREGRCIRYTGIRLLLLIRPFISSVFFLSNFQILKILVALFPETVRPIKFTLDTNVDNGRMYHVYRNQAAASYLSLISVSPMFKKFFKKCTLFSGTVRPKKFKLLHLSTMGGCIMYTRIRLLPLICPFISSFFFSPIIEH